MVICGNLLESGIISGIHILINCIRTSQIVLILVASLIMLEILSNQVCICDIISCSNQIVCLVTEEFYRKV